MSKREFNPATSSITHSQAREIAEMTGLCADGERCGTPPEIGDEAYCIDCPNRLSADTAPNGMEHDFLLTVKYRDDTGPSEHHMAREDAFAKANNLDLGEIEWAEVSDPEGVMLWDHISGEVL
jgi:hypothetical protein